jgi:hypothetical protein
MYFKIGDYKDNDEDYYVRILDSEIVHSENRSGRNSVLVFWTWSRTTPVNRLPFEINDDKADNWQWTPSATATQEAEVS